MRPKAVLREAWRNVLTGTSRTLILAAALATVSTGLAVADLVAVNQLVAEADRFQASGASILTIAAPGRIDGATCEALGALPGVRAAGAIRDNPAQLRVAALPQSPLLLKDVTPGFPALLTRDVVPDAGVILPRTAADQLAVAIGDDLTTTTGSAHIVGIFDYPDDGRRPGFGYAALLRSNGGQPYDECWADAWPQIDSLPALLLTTVRPSGGGPDEEKPRLAQLNATLGTSFDGGARFAGRVTLLATPLAAAVGVALGYLAVRLRRVQLASALHSRVARRELFAMLLLETASWCIPVLAIGGAVAASYAALGAAADHGSNLILGLRIPVVAVAAALVGVTVGMAATREKHLFRYFKDR